MGWYMQRISSHLLLIVLLVPLLAIAAVAESDESKAKRQRARILVLDDATSSSRFGFDFRAGLFREMREYTGRACCLYTEMLGLRNKPEGFEARSVEYLIKKFPPGSVDIIISMFPGTGELILNYDLFPNVPKIAIAAGTALGNKLRERDDFVVMPDSQTVAKTMENIQYIYPGTRKLFVIGGASSVSQSFVERTENSLSRMSHPFETEYLLGLSMEELLPRVRRIPSDAVILYLVYLNDKNGRNYRSPDMLELVSSETEVPVFGIVNTLIGNGILGASAVEGGKYGKLTFEIANDLLNGIPVSYPIRIDELVAPYFDWQQMQKQDLSKADLPENSIVLFEPQTLWNQYRKEVIATSVSLFSLVFVVVSLAFAMLRQRKTEQELRESELQLRRSESDYRLLADNSSDLIFKVIGDKITYVSPAVFEMRGFTPEEVMQQSLEESVTQESWEKTLNEFSVIASSRGESSSVLELEMFHKNGAKIPVEVAISSFRDDEHDQYGFIGVVRDIRDRKEAENERKKLEVQVLQDQKMQAMGVLAGGVAHDFNNILGSIMGFAELCLMDAKGDKRSSENLEQVLSACERGRDLTQQILNFARKDTDQKQILEINPLIQENLKLIKESIPDDIVINISVASEPCIVESSQSQIHQIVLNLVNNAVLSMIDKGGALNIKVEKISFPNSLIHQPEKLPEGHYVCLKVSDSGDGMDSDTVSRAFDPFFTTRPQGSGTGLGLSVVHGIVKSHDGEIDLDSQQGKGTSVSVYLPLAKREGAKEDSEDTISVYGNERILFVDDEEQLLATTEAMFKRYGYTITTYSSPVEALRVFRADPDQFDLVITDQKMPELSGIELLGLIRQSSVDIPVLLCTGYSELVNEEEAAGVGFDAMVNKPFRAYELLSRVRSVLDGTQKTVA